MPTYLVEEMQNDRATRSRTIDAPTPLVAASKLINRKLNGRTWEKDWIRVTDEARGKVFSYSIADKDTQNTKAARREKPTSA
ncbi:hypothetical protein [Mesorhizobium sp. INR15]|uniref:hypothetical protein n=1 Tax=Mesorhizobium sp. INR15 TaxID=2654248 RepID=UPI001896745C|nr:hypothetical protein [Mesorhizobium sp. INR15]QPC91670.1 hypothetical protein GA829_14300 [Mesorhizobium sp. INR15]